MKLNKKGQVVGVMVSLLITVLLGVILLGVIGQFTNNVTSVTSVGDDHFTASNNTCVRVTTNCLQSTGFSIENGSSVPQTGNFSICGGSGDLFGFSLDSDGYAQLDGASVNATYSETDCGYITNATNRTIINYFALLLGVVLIAFVGMFISK